MNNFNHNSLIFARVSSREQQEEGYSIESQLRLLKEYADKKQFKVCKIFEVPESARNSDERSMFQEMLEYIKKKQISHIICEKVDRITRNLKDATKLDDWRLSSDECYIHFVKDSLIIHKNSKANETFQWDIKVVLARQYSNNLSEEVRKGLDEKVEQGWYAGCRKRGYASVRPDGQKRAIWIQDATEQSELPYVKKAFELYAYNDYSLKELRKAMFKEGWQTKDNKPIPKSTLAELLADCFYCGKFEWKGKVYQGNHEGIISEELFETVQVKLHKKGHTKYSTHNHLFKNLITCAECGCAYTAEIQKGHTYYHCTRYKPCSQKKYIREELVESQIINDLQGIEIKNKRLLDWLQKALKESHQDEINYHNQTISSLNQQYKQIQTRLDTLYIDRLDGRIPLQKYDELEKKFRNDQEQMRKSLEKHENANIKYFELGINLLELAHRAKNLYATASKDKKRQLLNLVFLNLSIQDEKVLIQRQKPFNIIAKNLKNEIWSG